MSENSLVHSLPLIGIDQCLWESVTDIARREKMVVGDLLSLIDQRRITAIDCGHAYVTLESAVRVFVTAYWRLSCPEAVRANR